MDNDLSSNLIRVTISNHETLRFLSYTPIEELIHANMDPLKLLCISTDSIVNICPTALDLITSARCLMCIKSIYHIACWIRFLQSTWCVTLQPQL